MNSERESLNGMGGSEPPTYEYRPPHMPHGPHHGPPHHDHHHHHGPPGPPHHGPF
jgi:hypothetical protein